MVKQKEIVYKQTPVYKDRQAKKIKFQKELKNISSQKRYREKKIESLSGSKKAKIERQILRLSKKQNKLKVQIWKKGEKHYKMVLNKRQVGQEISKIQKKIDDPTIDKDEKRKYYEKQRLLKKEREILKELIESPDIYSITDTEIDYIDMQGGPIDGEPDQFGPWDMSKEVNNRINSGKYEYIVIYFPDGTKYKYSVDDLLKIELAVTRLEQLITENRDTKKGSTPKVSALYDEDSKIIYLNTDAQ